MTNNDIKVLVDRALMVGGDIHTIETYEHNQIYVIQLDNEYHAYISDDIVELNSKDANRISSKTKYGDIATKDIYFYGGAGLKSFTNMLSRCQGSKVDFSNLDLSNVVVVNNVLANCEFNEVVFSNLTFYNRVNMFEVLNHTFVKDLYFTDCKFANLTGVTNFVKNYAFVGSRSSIQFITNVCIQNLDIHTDDLDNFTFDFGAEHPYENFNIYNLTLNGSPLDAKLCQSRSR